MASDNVPPAGSDGVSPAKRKRLQACFTHASKQSAQENYDYATELFSSCVIEDPLNLPYAQSFLTNLHKKYNNDKKGSKLAFIRGAGARSAIKKALGQEDWITVMKQGCEALKLNPWDTSTLRAMATAVEGLGGGETTLYYLKAALETNPKDPDVNRQCAMALTDRSQFDQAIACWHRVEQAKPGDEEAQRAIANLAVQKTISQGGYEENDPNKKRMPPRPGQAAAQPTAGTAEAEMTPEERLKQAIARHPDELSNYLELGLLYIDGEHYKDAAEVYAKAYEVSGEDPDIRDRWEDAEIRLHRQLLAQAERQIEQTGSAEAKAEYKRLRKELNEKELQNCKSRCERFPNNLAFKYDLGVRYQIAGDYGEAIKQFQTARNDPRRKGVCMLALGQCFQAIKQQRLALTHYESAIEEIPDRDTTNKKLALYQTGKLLMSMEHYDAAEKHLSTLAGMDFSYKDVKDLLDKIDRLRDNQAGPQ